MSYINKLRIESNGNCGPSSISAEFIVAFHKGELDASFGKENWQDFVITLCVENAVNLQTSTKESFKAFLDKYENYSNPYEAQDKLAAFIRKRMSELMGNKRAEQEQNILTELKEHWNILVNQSGSLDVCKHAFYNMQAELKEVRSEKDFFDKYKAKEVFDKYVNIIATNKEYITAEMMEPLINHLNLNLTVKHGEANQQHVHGFPAPTITLLHTIDHFESQLLHDESKKYGQTGLASAVVCSSHSIWQDARSYLINKKKNEAFKYDNKSYRTTELTADEAEKERKQIAADKRVAEKLQQEEIDAYRASGSM